MNHLKRLLLIFVFFLFLIISYFLASVDLFSSPDEVLKFMSQFESFKPLIIILLIILEVVVLPLPGAIIAIASGYMFGSIYGTFYSWIGNVLGTLIAFWISRKFGRPFAKLFVPLHLLEKYDGFFQRYGSKMLWLAYLFPIFPSDITSFVTGLSKFPFRYFAIIVSIGYLPNMFIWNFFGQSLYEQGLSRFNLTLLSVFLLIALVFLAYEHISSERYAHFRSRFKEQVWKMASKSKKK